jgi:sulfur-oxidizing protein SoxX
MHVARWLAQALWALCLPAFAQTSEYVVVGDAIPASLTGTPGDAAQGRAIVVNRGTCRIPQASRINRYVR